MVPHYFAYGSNMSRARLEDRVGSVRDLGRARLNAYRHGFSKLGSDGTGKGNIERPQPDRLDGEQVWGVLYEIDERQLERLHDFEFGYRSRALEIRLDAGRRLSTVSYEALEPKPGLVPTPEYLEHYRQGMLEHGIPAGYVDAVLGEFAHLLRAS